MKRAITLTAGLVAGLLLAPQTALGAGFQNYAQSATSTAMGGIGIANPDEPNSSFYNPAAMAFHERFNVYAGDTLIVPNTTYEAPDGSTTETQDAVLPPPNFHLAVPFMDRFAAGVGLTFPYGLTIDWPNDWEGRDIVQMQRLTTVDVNPSIAYRLAELDLSFSVGMQVVWASLELNRAQILRPDREVGVQFGGTGWGVGGTAAVMYKVTPEWTLGLNYRSAVGLAFDGRAHFEGEEGTPFEEALRDQEVTTELTLPHFIGAGVGYDLGGVFLSADVGYTTWETYDQIEVEFSEACEEGNPTCEPGETSPPTAVILGDWEGAPAFRAGIEYRLLNEIPLRAGFGYDLSPIPSETVSPSLPGNDRAVFSLGSGYTWQGVRGDLAYQLVRTSREIDNGNQNGKYTTIAHLFALNLGYGY